MGWFRCTSDVIRPSYNAIRGGLVQVHKLSTSAATVGGVSMIAGVVCWAYGLDELAVKGGCDGQARSLRVS